MSLSPHFALEEFTTSITATAQALRVGFATALPPSAARPSTV